MAAKSSNAEGRIELGDGRIVELGSPIGRGSFAAVHRGLVWSRHGVARSVVVKLVSAVSSEEAEQVLTSLVRTARRLASVDHPNVARTYECGAWRGQPYLLGELVEGVSLATFQGAYAQRQRRVPLDLALFVASEIAEALAAARVARDHSGARLGILHGGLSSREVLLSRRGEVKVTDFELDIARGASSSVRSLRGVAGRAAAMAPEVAQGSPPDARSDVFSLGVLMRELFVGPRFPPTLANAEAARLVREGYIQPLTFRPQLPEGLVAIMERALAVDPGDRYPNACAMAFELRREALAMGVGDGRYFLRRALEREWPEEGEEITEELTEELTEEHTEELELTEEHMFAPVEPDEPYAGEVVPFERRR